MNSIELGKFLANLRMEKKLTQEELAEKLFIDKRKVSRWECGMSIPDFETLIKLSEILNVSLYELSICKRLDKEKLNRKAINKFKGIKDFKKYKLRKKLKIILAIFLGVVFLFTFIYTIKFYGTVEIYEFKSLDDKYAIDGTYVKTNDYLIYSINDINLKSTNASILNDLDECKYEIFDNSSRIFHIEDHNKGLNNNQNVNLFKLSENIEFIPNEFVNNELYFKLMCFNNTKLENDLTIKFEFTKKYDNKLL